MEINKVDKVKLIESLLKEMPVQKSNPESEVIYRSNDMIVVVPHTKSASCRYGAGTKW
jgi:hypothetical protein